MASSSTSSSLPGDLLCCSGHLDERLNTRSPLLCLFWRKVKNLMQHSKREKEFLPVSELTNCQIQCSFTLWMFVGCLSVQTGRRVCLHLIASKCEDSRYDRCYNQIAKALGVPGPRATLLSLSCLPFEYLTIVPLIQVLL